MSYTDFIYFNLCALREWKALLLEKEIMYTDLLSQWKNVQEYCH